MEILDSAIQYYIEGQTSPEPSVLSELNRETHAKVLMPRMLSGHVQGRFLAMISKMIQPTKILEIGTYTGYSAICLAEGLKNDGILITIDVNEELEEMAGQFFSKAGVKGKISQMIGNALVIIPKLEHKFNLVFIDADKANYLNYFNLVIDKVNKGGYILADNVLWSGKVLDKNPDKDSLVIINFNKAIQNDPRVENVIVPMRDGLMLIRKL
ncbi:MAG: O-methyltransferase [Bacteroidota bacterium]|nr:O-methyltransferase [Bacteroidota bacterium]